MENQPPTTAKSSSTDIVHQQLLTYFPNKTIKGRYTVLLRWHEDNTFDATKFDSKTGQLEDKIFAVKPTDIALIRFFGGNYFIKLKDGRNFKIGLSQKDAVIMGAASGLVGVNGVLGAVAAGNIVASNKIDSWWGKQFKANGIKYNLFFFF